MSSRVPFPIALILAMIASPTEVGLVFTVRPVMVLFWLAYGTMAMWAAGEMVLWVLAFGRESYWHGPSLHLRHCSRRNAIRFTSHSICDRLCNGLSTNPGVFGFRAKTPVTTGEQGLFLVD